MNCSDAEPFLDLLTRDSGNFDIPDETALRQHLTSCPSCQKRLQSQQTWDRQLTDAMINVTIPHGITDRLVAMLQENTPSERSQSGSKRLIRGIELRARWLTGIAFLAFALSLWWTMTFPSGQLSSSNVASLWEKSPEIIPVNSPLPKKLPHGWSSLKNISEHEWQQVSLENPQLVVSIKPFEIRDRQREPEQGWLFVIPRSRWNSNSATSPSQSQVQYSSSRVWIAWSEGEFAFVLTLAGSPQPLERLQRQLDGNNAVF